VPLRKREIAELAQDSLLHFDGERYKLVSWTVMPNHLHLLLKPLAGNELSQIMHSLKSYTANEANKILGRKGKFWQEDYYDRYIRNYEHFENTVEYRYESY
jgi:REP element-mobilizing transposase RayT